ncbi:MAG: ABC transporter ATP-binding protein [Granulosicoccus sp.]|nr:ABC transporter ATP-binding protein [Granulosicoccus sp.]
MMQLKEKTHSVEVKNLDLSFGATDVLKGLNLAINEGEFLVLLGSSGCGKSTLLNCIAGLLEVSDGQIFIQGKNVTWSEPSERGIGMVFQSYALYPQMTVKGNLSFGLKNQRIPKAEIEKRVSKAAEMLQIESLLKRKPGALSGGQRQRVAIGRALVRDVDVFLFDEPLSNLDAKLRTDLRVELKLLHQQLGNTMIYVTHDQVEAMTLADRIAIMKDGVIQQLAEPNTIYAKPVNKYVADFIGSPSMNFLEGLLDFPYFSFGSTQIDVSHYEQALTFSGRAWLGIRPEHVRSADPASQCDFQTTLKVDLVEPMGSDTQVWSTLENSPFRFRVEGQTTLKPGDSIAVGFNVDQVSLFDVSTETRL